MFANELFDLSKLVARKSPVPFQLNRIEPELRLVSISAHVNVRRFVQDIMRIEIKLVRPDSKNCRHVSVKITYKRRDRAITKMIRAQTGRTGTNDR